jgi:hypothetical protein
VLDLDPDTPLVIDESKVGSEILDDVLSIVSKKK